MNDSDLVQGLREQDPAAVRQLSECILPSLWRYVYVRIKRDPHLAEDIVSESVLALIRAAADDAADISNVGGWLRAVAGNKVSDHFRAVARVQHVIDEAVQKFGTDEESDPAVREELKERRAAVRDAMDSLPEQQRLALEWKYIEQRSVRDIAGLLDLTEKAAESILYRARRDLREILLRSDRKEAGDLTLQDGDPCCGQPVSGVPHVCQCQSKNSPREPEAVNETNDLCQQSK